MNILVIDVGGTHVKMLVSDRTEPRQFVSGPGLTPARMVEQAQAMTSDWTYEAIAIGYPGLVVHGPLLATLLLDLLRRNLPQANVARFTFRANRPLFDIAPEADGFIT